MFFKYYFLFALPIAPVNAQEQTAEEIMKMLLLQYPIPVWHCVKDRNCYADVEVTWRQQQIGNYCLRNSDSKHIIQCWLMQQKGCLGMSLIQQKPSVLSYNSDNGKIVASLKYSYSGYIKTVRRNVVGDCSNTIP